MKIMKNIKIFIKYFLVLSIVSLFAVTLFNVEKINIFIGDIHIFENSQDAGGGHGNKLSADKVLAVSGDKQEAVQANTPAAVSSDNAHEELTLSELEANEDFFVSVGLAGNVISQDEQVSNTHEGSITTSDDKDEATPSARETLLLSGDILEDKLAKTDTAHSKTAEIARTLKALCDMLRTHSEKFAASTDIRQSDDIKPESYDSLPKVVTFTGYLKDRQDKNINKFTLDRPCAVNIGFKPSEGDKAYYNLTVAGASGNVVLSALPNIVIEDKGSPLRMIITINGHEFTYNIR